MVAGYDRYFQIARCFRDEDLRADRQPEFTQIDLEASFISAEDIQDVIERVLLDLWAEGGAAVSAVPRITYREAMERFGIDKPDLRFGYEIRDLTALIGSDAASFLAESRPRAVAPRHHRRRWRRDEPQGPRRAHRRGQGGKGGWADLGSPRPQRLGRAGREGGGSQRCSSDWVGRRVICSSPSWARMPSPRRPPRDRTALIRRPDATPSTAHAFTWVVDFPLFEHDPDSGQYVPAHHPFTAPHPEDLGKLESDPGSCRALHYDAVYNGVELGSGSIRITDPAIQRLIFSLLGIPESDVRRRFGFLSTGWPRVPRRMAGSLSGSTASQCFLSEAGSLRDVIAFPKTTTARALFEGAPTPVDPADLKALHLEVKP